MNLTDFRTLGRSGLRVSPLCLGAMTFGENWGGFGADTPTSVRMMDRYIDQGGNFIDTANMYVGGQSEEIIGQHIGSTAKRDGLVLASKFGASMRPGQPNAGGASRKNVIEACESSLRRMRTDYLDLYWLHWWDQITPIEETIQAMDDLVRAGKVRYIGFSDVPAWKTVEAQMIARTRGWAPLIAIQVEHSLLERTVERDMLPMARDQGFGVTVWSPLRAGILTGKYHGDTPAQTSSTRGDYVKAMLDEHASRVVSTLKTVAMEAGTTPARAALSWLLARPGVTAPIIGARSLEQLDDNLAALEVSLSDDHMVTLDQVSRVRLGFPHEINALNMAMSYPDMKVDGRTYSATGLVPDT